MSKMNYFRVNKLSMNGPKVKFSSARNGGGQSTSNINISERTLAMGIKPNDTIKWNGVNYEKTISKS